MPCYEEPHYFAAILCFCAAIVVFSIAFYSWLLPARLLGGANIHNFLLAISPILLMACYWFMRQGFLLAIFGVAPCWSLWLR